MNFQKNKIEPGKWHCDNCDRSISVCFYCIDSKFYYDGFTTIKGWKCPNCKSIQDETSTKCINNKCNKIKLPHFPIQEFTFWKCPKDNLSVEKGSKCSKCWTTNEHYNYLKK